MKTWFRTHLFEILDVLKFVGIVVLVLMFIRFNSVVAENARIAKENTATTKAVVQSQSTILEAIKQLSIDTKVSNEQKTNIIICMLQVPIGQRTTDTLNNCRKQSEQTSSISTQQTPQSHQSVQPSNSKSNKPQSLFDQILKRLGL